MSRSEWRHLELEIIEAVHIVGRAAVSEGHIRDAGQTGDLPGQLVPERRASTLCIPRVGQHDLTGEYIPGVEAEIDAAKLVQAAQKQSRDDEKGRGDRELTPDYDSPQTSHRAAAGG